MFQRLIDQQLERVRNSPQAGMLGEKVYEKLEGSLKRLTGLITQSTEAQLIARAADNPFAAALPALLTEEEKADARDRLLRVKSKFVCKLLLGTCGAKGCLASLS